MAVFPSSPSLNEIFTHPTTGMRWRWDGVRWNGAGGPGGGGGQLQVGAPVAFYQNNIVPEGFWWAVDLRAGGGSTAIGEITADGRQILVVSSTGNVIYSNGTLELSQINAVTPILLAPMSGGGGGGIGNPTFGAVQNFVYDDPIPVGWWLADGPSNDSSFQAPMFGASTVHIPRGVVFSTDGTWLAGAATVDLRPVTFAGGG
jgi:hypothetical protein